ncbi:MAG: hypothetical protein M3443_07375 [Actinomycetota bacterium]|nr:hypothetical protein [Actinomycetota bacterium]
MTIGPGGRAPSAPDRFLVLSLRLRDRRRSLGLTQQQVVRRLAAFGVTTTNKALSSLEHGAGIDAAKLPEFAAALDCTVTYLLGLTDNPSNWQPDSSLGLRAIPSHEPTSPAPTDLDVLEVEPPPSQRHTRREPTRPSGDQRSGEGTSWILGPYPAGGVPGDPGNRADTPGTG